MTKMASFCGIFLFSWIQIEKNTTNLFRSFICFFNNPYINFNISLNIRLSLNAKTPYICFWGEKWLFLTLSHWHYWYCCYVDIVAFLILLFHFSKIFVRVLIEHFNEFIWNCKAKIWIRNKFLDLSDKVYFNHLKYSFPGFSIFKSRFECF